MKLFSSFLVVVCTTLAAFAAFSPAAAGGTPPPLVGERVLWLGDSITQAGDYVTFVEYYLEKTYPTDSVDIISIGRSSETASGLSEKTHPFKRPCILDRLPRALEVTKPKVVVACYGMNDGIYHPFGDERFTAFQSGIQSLITAVRAKSAKILLLTPPPFDVTAVKNPAPASATDFSYNSPYPGYDTVLDAFARWEMALKGPNVGVIDLHGAVEQYVAKRRRENGSFTLVKDGVHPSLLGHLVMAHVILQALDVPVPDEANLENELTAIQADPLYALVKKSRETRSSAWMTYVGLPGAIEQAEADVAKTQNEIDQLRRKPAP